MAETENDQDPKKRYAKNLLLQPNLQIKLGVVSVAVALLFSGLIFGLVYLNLSNFYTMVLDLTPLQQEVTEILEDYVRGLSRWILILLFIYLVVNVFLSVYYTHRLVGPTIAFRRHIRSLINGNAASRVNLRKNDAFTEVADDLNELAEKMQMKNIIGSDDIEQ